MTLYSLSPRNSSHPIKDDAPSRIISSATIAFPILSRHWPHFDEEYAASVIKNKEHGVSKVIPDKACLASAYRRAKESAFVQQKIDAALAEAGVIGKVEIPDTLGAEVKDRLSKNAAATWDSIIRDLAEQEFADREDGE